MEFKKIMGDIMTLIASLLLIVIAGVENDGIMFLLSSILFSWSVIGISQNIKH